MIEYGTFKHKLLSTMVIAGEYPYKSLDLMMESPIRKREVINQLKDKGYIDIKTISGIKRIRFKMFDKKKNQKSQTWKLLKKQMKEYLTL